MYCFLSDCRCCVQIITFMCIISIDIYMYITYIYIYWFTITNYGQVWLIPPSSLLHSFLQTTHEYPPVEKKSPRMPCACSAVPNGRSTRPISPSTSCKPNCEAFVTTRPRNGWLGKFPIRIQFVGTPDPFMAELHGGLKMGVVSSSQSSSFPDSPCSFQDKRGQGCMLLGLAEAQLAKALAGEAISTLVEEVAGHLTRDEQWKKGPLVVWL